MTHTETELTEYILSFFNREKLYFERLRPSYLYAFRKTRERDGAIQLEELSGERAGKIKAVHPIDFEDDFALLKDIFDSRNALFFLNKQTNKKEKLCHMILPDIGYSQKIEYLHKLLLASGFHPTFYELLSHS